MDNPHDRSYFVETLGGISIVNGVIHMDFYVQEAPRPEEDEPKLVFSHRLNMPLRGFVSTAQTLDSFIKQLAEKGVLKGDRREPSADATKVEASHKDSKTQTKK